LPGYGIELKSHFKNDLLQFDYNEAFSRVPLNYVTGQFYCIFFSIIKVLLLQINVN